MHNPTIAVLSSGGLDSCILISHLVLRGQVVQPVYIRSQLVWEPAELAALQCYLQRMQSQGLRELVVLDLPLTDVYGRHWSVTGEQPPGRLEPDEAVYLPGRNAMLLLKTSLWCHLNGVGHVALGALATSPFPDATAAFLNQLQAVLRFYTSQPPDLLLPFAGMDKLRVMQLGAGFPLELTFSCLAPVSGQHCGRCNKCEERRRAFAQAGRRDLTAYAG